MDYHHVSDSFANYSNLGPLKMEKEQQACELRMDWITSFDHNNLGINAIFYRSKLFI